MCTPVILRGGFKITALTDTPHSPCTLCQTSSGIEHHESGIKRLHSTKVSELSIFNAVLEGNSSFILDALIHNVLVRHTQIYVVKW